MNITDRTKENFYKYLLFFKKYSKSTINTESNDGLSVNPAIETILFAEKRIRDFGKEDSRVPLRTTGVRERDYYEKFSLEKTLKEAKAEYDSLSEIFKKRIEKFDPRTIKPVDNKGKINENILFFRLLTNDDNLDDEEIEGIFNRYKNYKTKMSYSFLKSLFCIKNESLEKILFNKDKTFFSFLFEFTYHQNHTKKETEKIKGGNFHINYFSKLFFHLKNQFLNLHFSNPSVVEKLHDTFTMGFTKKLSDNYKLAVKLTQPNVFFPDLSIMNDKFLESEESVSKLPIFKFMLQRYHYGGADNLNSFIYSMYFPKDEIMRLFSTKKIKKDLGSYIRITLKKSRPSLEEIKVFERKMNAEFNKIIAKMSDSRLINAFVNSISGKESVQGAVFVPYIGEVKFKRKKLEELTKVLKTLYIEDNLISNKFLTKYAIHKSVYKNGDARTLAATALTHPVIEFKEIFKNPQKKSPQKEPER